MTNLPKGSSGATPELASTGSTSLGTTLPTVAPKTIRISDNPTTSGKRVTDMSETPASGAKKAAAKKVATKKAVAKKPVAKKAATKKPAAKKAATKKPVARKTTAKKVPAKKPVARKATAKRASRTAALRSTVTAATTVASQTAQTAVSGALGATSTVRKAAGLNGATKGKGKTASSAASFRAASKSLGDDVFRRVNELVDNGKTAKAAFDVVAKESGMSVSNVQQHYYRFKRKAQVKARSTRKNVETRARQTSASAGRARSAVSSASATLLQKEHVDLLAQDLQRLAGELQNLGSDVKKVAGELLVEVRSASGGLTKKADELRKLVRS